MAQSPPARLPRRDFLLLPLISLATILVMLGLSEITARYVFVERWRGSCGVPDDLHGYRFKPNCTAYVQAAEGPEVESAFNDCGYRTKEPCAPPPPGTIRVATLGASTAEGLKVQYDQIFLALTGKSLTQLCNRPVEFQNMGVAGYKPLDQYLRVDEALALKPDIVMMVIVPFDMEEATDPKRLANRKNPELLRRAKLADDAATQPSHGLYEYVGDLVSNSRAIVAAQHFLYQDPATYTRLYLALGDKAGFLRVPLSPAWERRLADLDLLLGEMADKIHAAGVPFFLVLGPLHAQAALLDPASRPPGIDPFAFGRRVAAIAAAHGILFMDALEGFPRTGRPDQAFYPVDGHMNAEGHQIFADALTRRFVDGSFPAFAGCRAAPQAQR